MERPRPSRIADAAVLWFFGILYAAALLILRGLRRAS
jgi:hypothetical protein